jgi:cobalt-precorrin 5A hydrolase
VAVNNLVLGIGCQRGTPVELLARGVDALLAEHGLSPARVCAIATVEHKRDERGLLELSEQRGWPITFYTREQLGDAVAEPAARRYAQAPSLLIRKRVYRDYELPGSMTLAVAVRSER